MRFLFGNEILIKISVKILRNVYQETMKMYENPACLLIFMVAGGRSQGPWCLGESALEI